MLVARRLAGAENPSRQTVSYLGYTTLVAAVRKAAMIDRESRFRTKGTEISQSSVVGPLGGRAAHHEPMLIVWGSIPG